MNDKQECIPVGCVPSAAVAISGGVSAWGCLPRGVSARWGVCLGGLSAQRGVSQHELGQTPLPMNRITDACENITFPQLLLRTVITLSSI